MLRLCRRLHLRARAALDAETLLYRAHHTHPANVRIHYLCVPLEWACAMHALTCLSPWLGAAAACALLLYYALATATCFGLVVGLAHPAMVAGSLLLRSALDPWTGSALVVAVFTTSWLLQVLVGHAVFEGGAPAFTKSLSLNGVLFSVLLALDS